MPIDPKTLRLIMKYISGDQIHDLKMHEQLCKSILNNDYEFVHKLKDRPSKWLGKGHRVLFHDAATNMAIGLVSKDPNAAIAGMLHDWLDFTETKLRRSAKNRL